MSTDTLTINRRDEEQRLRSLVDELYEATGGRGKRWQAAKRAIKLTLAINTATGARKVALQRKLDALAKKYAA